MTLRKFTKKIKNNIKKYLVNGFLILLLFFTGAFVNYVSYPIRYNYAKNEYKKENYEKSTKDRKSTRLNSSHS